MKNYKLVNIRAFAITLVVLAHSIIIYNPYWNLYTSNVSSQFFEYLCLCICIFHMPLFFALSGYLFDKSKSSKGSFLNFAITKFKRLIIPFIYFALLWLLPIRYLVHYNNYVNNNILYNIIVNIFLGKDCGHLWYLPSLFIIFLIYYVLNKYIKNNKILFALTILISFLGYFIPSFLGSAMQNIVWFGLGSYISKEKSQKYSKSKIYLSILLLIILFSAYLFSYGRIEFYKYICLAIKYVACIILIPLMFELSPNKTNKFILNLDSNSFGIYLFHSPLIYITYSTNLINYPLLVFLINFILFGTISYFATLLIKKTKLKFMIGESK